MGYKVALYLLSSPNHNQKEEEAGTNQVALYLLSSPNHNRVVLALLIVPVALYLLSSPNHNNACMTIFMFMLRYIFFHHQTTTKGMSNAYDY